MLRSRKRRKDEEQYGTVQCTRNSYKSRTQKTVVCPFVRPSVRPSVPSPFTNPDFTAKPYNFFSLFFRQDLGFDDAVNLVPITFGSKNCKKKFLGLKQLLSLFVTFVLIRTNPDLRPNRITFFHYFFVKIQDSTTRLIWCQ